MSENTSKLTNNLIEENSLIHLLLSAIIKKNFKIMPEDSQQNINEINPPLENSRFELVSKSIYLFFSYVRLI